MKRTSITTAFAVALTLGLASCGSDNQPDNPGDDTVNAKDIDYTSANSKSWHNYMINVALLLSDDAQSLCDAWTVSYNGGEPFATTFKNHSKGAYQSALNCLEQIVDGCADIANEVGTAKIGDPYNLYMAGRTEEALYAVESWYSWHSRDDYTNNIRSIRNSYYGSLDGTVNTHSMSALIAEADPDLDARLKAAIQKAADDIQAIPQPFRNHINSSEANVAMESCASLEALLSNDLKRALNSMSGNDEMLDAIVESYVDEVVVPTYRNLVSCNNALRDAVNRLARNPSDAAFESACDAWLEAREPWEKSEAFLFGPVDQLGLDPNMDSWPLDQNAIVQNLNTVSFDDLDWSDGDSDDVIEAAQNLRGFHTLEFLLFKDGQPRRIKE